jgi:hypothetical protein
MLIVKRKVQCDLPGITAMISYKTELARDRLSRSRCRHSYLKLSVQSRCEQVHCIAPFKELRTLRNPRHDKRVSQVRIDNVLIKIVGHFLALTLGTLAR